MTTQVQIHGSFPSYVQGATIEADVKPGERPLEDAIDHLLKINRSLSDKIKTNEKRFHMRHQEEQRLNRMLLKRVNHMQNLIAQVNRDINNLDTKGCEIR